jgi:hypothetical protein
MSVLSNPKRIIGGSPRQMSQVCFAVKTIGCQASCSALLEFALSLSADLPH